MEKVWNLRKRQYFYNHFEYPYGHFTIRFCLDKCGI